MQLDSRLTFGDSHLDGAGASGEKGQLFAALSTKPAQEGALHTRVAHVLWL